MGRADHTSMGAWTGRSASKIWENDKKKGRKLRERVRKTQIRQKSHQNLWDFVRSGFNLTGFNEISLDSVKISLDLHEIAPKSGFLSPESRIFSPESRFLSDYGFFAGQFGFLGERNQNWPVEVGFWWRKSAVDHRSRSGQPFRIGSGRVSGWVGSLDMFGQPYICLIVRLTNWKKQMSLRKPLDTDLSFFGLAHH